MSDNSVKTVVFKEHTLGLLAEGQVHTIEPLRSLVTKGAPFSVFDDPFIADPDDYRPATLADFKEFRVKWHKDYLVSDHETALAS